MGGLKDVESEESNDRSSSGSRLNSAGGPWLNSNNTRSRLRDAMLMDLLIPRRSENLLELELLETLLELELLRSEDLL